MVRASGSRGFKAEVVGSNPDFADFFDFSGSFCELPMHHGEIDLPCSHYLIELGDKLPRFVIKSCGA